MVDSITNQEKCYTHFSLAEREEIAIGRERGESMSFIAKSLGLRGIPFGQRRLDPTGDCGQTPC
jgi:hypothetical protein